ncbi:uncharacterized protein K452DRAFT_283565 [Aplosporella prunicola CBS 121167]|uniref:Autophagy-related protein 29 n=1 Tax=Aplosporella prunicola CBS 121167 TaxID=1176127 RepID=A0A6A6BQK6_9PEZI|nr:uncharacterized protein K452DRAFT_283565 [Aplosporella prunicola CBS 121167]KAF2146290.1 hypothetical protein K452DRAFT_283565 [Aplosporella prunicola CBS 121167]
MIPSPITTHTSAQPHRNEQTMPPHPPPSSSSSSSDPLRPRAGSGASTSGHPPPTTSTSSGRPPTNSARSAAAAAAAPSPAPRRPATALAEPQVRYTVVVRLPFSRGAFVDPAQVEWDATKDQALWKIISKNARTSELDWQELALRFEVPQSFLLQQAAWLYERHLSHVRAQMRKVGSTSAAGTGGSSLGVGQGKGVPRATSSLSVRSRDSPVPPRGGIGSGPGTPGVGAPVLSRTPSATTITQSRLMQQQQPPPPSPRQPVRSSFKSSFSAPRRTSPALEPTAEASHPHSRAASPVSPPALSDSDASSSSRSDDDDNPFRRSQLFRRAAPRFRARTKLPALARLNDDDDDGYAESHGSAGVRGGDSDADDDDGSDDVFLPFAQPPSRRAQPLQSPLQQHPHQQDPGATLRDRDRDHNRPPTSSRRPLFDTRARPSASSGTPLSAVAQGKQPLRSLAQIRQQQQQQQAMTTAASTSSATSASDIGAERPDTASTVSVPSQSPSTRGTPGGSGAPGPLSPRHRAELARLGRLPGEGSEGTPSMGSSFSDLDDASVTQSALEEQLLSTMQHAGGMSKMSTISRAFGSRYL